MASKEERYDFKTLKGYKSGFSLMQGIVLILVLGLVSACVGMFIISSNRVKEANEKIWIMDHKGLVYPASMNEITASDRAAEYHNHVNMLIELWYEFDENNFDKNISQGVYLLGDCSAAMKDVYNQYDMKDQLLQKNLRYQCEAKEINFDWSQSPVQGEAIIEQSVTRGVNVETRIFKATFIMLDKGVNRSIENPHGLKIENWKVSNKTNE